MYFNSLTYICFLALAVCIYWLSPLKHSRWLLLIASIVFYGFWRVEFLCLIVFSAFVDYYVSLRISDAGTQSMRKFWLCVSLVINLGLLAYFKYTYFIAHNIEDMGRLAGQQWHFVTWNIILPLGISFYTFVSLSYTIDIYRRLLEPVRDFSVYLTYVMFWPHMIAGPILRGHELIGQLKQGHRFNAQNVLIGIKYILTGLFLKVVLADQLAPVVDSAFLASPKDLGGLDVWTMAFAFGFQIYFDFAGYSLIAIGSARLIGIRFPQNFNWPYLAVSPRDFWKRWHITLSSWVRDYLYLPLSSARYRDSSEGGIDIQASENGKERRRQRMTFALFLSWFLMGLWHGASWNFALWGLWHACLIYAYRIVKGRFDWMPKKLLPIAGWITTLPLVMLGWIPFRARSLRQTLSLYSRAIDISSYTHISFRENTYLIVFLITAGMLLAALVSNAQLPFFENVAVRRVGEATALSVMIFGVFIFLKPVTQFIYFQF